MAKHPNPPAPSKAPAVDPSYTSDGSPTAEARVAAETTLLESDADTVGRLRTAVDALSERLNGLLPATAPAPEVTPESILALIEQLNASAAPDGQRYDLRYAPVGESPARERETSKFSVTQIAARAVGRIPVAPQRSGWPREIAFARRLVRLEVPVLGGEFVVDGQRMKQVRGDPSFEVVTVVSPEHIAAIEAEYALLVADVRRVAAECGLVVYRDGEVTPPRVRT